MLRKLLAGAILLCSACVSTPPPAGKPEPGLTVGTVQREIRVGMSGAEVVEALGSPNIVTTDDQRRESWVYDKMSTQASYDYRQGFLFALIVGGAEGSGTASVSQKSLTIVIKFDDQHKVRDFAYHSSTF